ncbi:MAG: hypothetical protein AB7G13_34280 [Lautropia sp.]
MTERESTDIARSPTPGAADWDDPTLATAYRALPAEPGPDAAIDRRILAAAHRAVGAGPRRDTPTPAHRTGSRRWVVPLSLAATLVLSVSLVLTMQREDPHRTAGADLHQPVPDETGAAGSPAPAAGPAMQQRREALPESSTPPASVVPKPARAMPAPPADPAAAAAPAAAVGPATPIAPAAPVAPVAPAAAAASAAPAAPVPPVPPANSTAPAAPAAATRSAESARRSAGAMTESRRSQADFSRQRAADEPIDAEGWIRTIERQLGTGDVAAARRSLQALRRNFPDHPVPSALLERLAG